MTTITTRAEATADLLRRAIQAGEYVSGERLVELTLAQQQHVSQNTVRDALRILEGEGWVVKHARRGVYVRSYTASEAMELYTLWATVEGLAMRWAVEGLSRSDLAYLWQLMSQAQRQAQRGDARGSTETIFALHEAIAELAGKPQTAALLKMLRNQVRLLETVRQNRAPRNLPHQEAQIGAYKTLLEVMKSRDKDAAQQAIYSLIMADSTTLLPLLDAVSR